MQKIEYTINDMSALSSIPVGMLLRRMRELGCTVTVCKGGRKADAGRMFALMCLGIRQGDTVTLLISGRREEEAAAFLRKFMEENL